MAQDPLCGLCCHGSPQYDVILAGSQVSFCHWCSIQYPNGKQNPDQNVTHDWIGWLGLAAERVQGFLDADS